MSLVSSCLSDFNINVPTSSHAIGEGWAVITQFGCEVSDLHGVFTGQ